MIVSKCKFIQIWLLTMGLQDSIEKFAVKIWTAITARQLNRRIGITVGLLVILIVGISTCYRASRGHGSQFDDFYYFSKDLLYDKVNIYEEYSFDRTTIAKYPPFFGVLFAPLVPLPFLAGAALWFLVGISMLYLAAKAIARMGWRLFKGNESEPPVFWWLVPLLLCLVIIMSNLATSQINIFIFSLIVLGLDHFINKRDHLTGIFLGIATAIKLTPGLFVLYFLYKGNWKVVLWASIGVILCWGIVLPAITGLPYYSEIMLSWTDMLKSYMLEGSSVDGLRGYKHTNQSLEAMFFRFFTHTEANGGMDNFYVNLMNLSQPTASTIVNFLKLFILITLGFICRTPVANRQSPGLMFEFSLVFLAILYISPISWINHYVVIILPFATCFYQLVNSDYSDKYRSGLLAALIIGVSLTYLTHPIFLAFSLAFFGSFILFIAICFRLRHSFVVR